MRIAWIGLGNMGGPMAANLVRAGHEVHGFDVGLEACESARSAGVIIAEAASEAAEEAEVVFTMLPSGQHVRDVYEGAGVLAAASPGTLFVDSSTIDIQTARDLHELVPGHGHRFVDAPVSGGVSGAAAGTLTFMIGGDVDQFEATKVPVEPMAGRVFHAGGPGAGQAAKIVNNMMAGINLAGLCEAATLAERLGLDGSTFQALAQVSSGDSWVLRTWYPVAGVVDTAAVNRDFRGGFSVDLFTKDLGLALVAGESTGTDLRHAGLVRASLQKLSSAGFGDRDCTLLVRLVDGSISIPE